VVDIIVLHTLFIRLLIGPTVNTIPVGDLNTFIILQY